MPGIMPTVFVSHGAPTLAIEEGHARTFLPTLGCHLPRPRAILCASAHWESAVPAVSGAARPETIEKDAPHAFNPGIEYGMLSMAAHGWFPPAAGVMGGTR